MYERKYETVKYLLENYDIKKEKSNYRNDYSSKTVKSQFGEFESQIVSKNKSGFMSSF